MGWEITGDVEEFAAGAGAFLVARPVEHNLLLTILDGLRRRGAHAYGGGEPVLGRWIGGGGLVEGVFLQTPPHPMIFSSLPERALEAALHDLRGRPLSGASLIASDVDAFVAGRQQQTGDSAIVKMRTRLYRLGTLTAPPAPGGAGRVAHAGDRALVLRLTREFADAIGEETPADAVVDDRLGYGGVTLWEDGGTVVAMVCRTRVEAGIVRVQLVYTPREQRGRGYAGAATTVVTREALALGASAVVLVADLDNLTSTGLYQRLGYRAVEDRVVVEFSS